MKWLAFTTLCLLVHYNLSKETVIYQATGGDLFDLIRGFPPKDALKVTKVEGDKASLTDGIYFIPEDDALKPEGTKYLNVKGKIQDLQRRR